MKWGRGVLDLPDRCSGMSKPKKALENIQLLVLGRKAGLESEYQTMRLEKLHKTRLSRAAHTPLMCLTYIYGEQMSCFKQWDDMIVFVF